MKMNIVDRLLSSHSFLGDPLHKEAAEAIQVLLDDMKKIVKAYEVYDTKTMADTAKQALKEFGNE